MSSNLTIENLQNEINELKISVTRLKNKINKLKNANSKVKPNNSYKLKKISSLNSVKPDFNSNCFDNLKNEEDIKLYLNEVNLDYKFIAIIKVNELFVRVQSSPIHYICYKLIEKVPYYVDIIKYIFNLYVQKNLITYLTLDFNAYEGHLYSSSPINIICRYGNYEIVEFILNFSCKHNLIITQKHPINLMTILYIIFKYSTPKIMKLIFDFYVDKSLIEYAVNLLFSSHCIIEYDCNNNYYTRFNKNCYSCNFLIKNKIPEIVLLHILYQCNKHNYKIRKDYISWIISLHYKNKCIMNQIIIQNKKYNNIGIIDKFLYHNYLNNNDKNDIDKNYNNKSNDDNNEEELKLLLHSKND